MIKTINAFTLFVIIFLLAVKGVAQTYVNTEMVVMSNTIVSTEKDIEIAEKGNLITNGELFVKENMVNHGLFTYNTSIDKGRVSFIGKKQSLKGKGITKFYNLLLSNLGLSLGANIEINNDANFQKGIVENRNLGGKIIFNSLSDHLNVSDDCYVDGKVEYKGTGSFVFPTGNHGKYRSVVVTDIDSNDVMEATYFAENSNVEYNHQNKSGSILFIDDAEYWEMHKQNKTADVFIELERKQGTSSDEIMNASIENLHIVRWDFDKELWIDEGGIVDTTKNTIKTISKVTGNGIFALAIYDPNKVTDNLIVYNTITPNNDGVNDYLLIKGIENYKNNTVRIFNRWGNLVWKTNNYNNKDRVFKGYSKMSMTIGNQDVLSTGTYFYVIEYKVNGTKRKKIDYIYLNNGK